MTWKEFKDQIESAGVTDDMRIVSVSYIGKSIDENIEVIVDEDDFSVYGISKQERPVL